MIHSRTPLAPWTATTGHSSIIAWRRSLPPQAAAQGLGSVRRTSATTACSTLHNRSWYPSGQ
jgi:hypothetical protein